MMSYSDETSSLVISVLYLGLLGWAWLALLVVYGTRQELARDSGGCSSPETIQRFGRFGSLAIAYLSLAVIAAFSITFLLGWLFKASWLALP